MRFKKIIIALIALVTLGSCNANPKTLKEAYKNYFPIGLTLNKNNYTNYEDILDNFNSMTCENEMKWSSVHPSDDIYIYDEADKMISYAKEHHLNVRGHALVWHEAIPAGVFLDKNQETISKEDLLKKMKNHIFNVVKHFKDDVYVWDVVNEVIDENEDPLNEDKTNVYRQSSWYNICGRDYILYAFQYAKEALNELEEELGRKMNVKLYYNDYSLANPTKREKLVEMIKYLQENNAPIDGIGMQSHYHINSFSQVEFENSINTYSSMGLEVQITEFDVSVYEPESKENYEMGLPEDIELIQASIFSRAFKILRKHKDVITGATFWGAADDSTYLDDLNPNRKDYPYMFNEYHEGKSSYYMVKNFLYGGKD